MATNVTLFPVDNQVVVYFQDGTTTVLQPQQEKSFQIPAGGFVTVSDAPDDSSTQNPGQEFIRERLVAFWQKLAEEIEENQPQVNPL